VRSIAEAKLADVEAKIRDLQRIRQVLGRLTRDCRNDEAETCPILDALCDET
jgi:chorismate mutase